VQAAVDWVLREEPDRLCDALAVPDGDRKKLVATLSTARAALLVLAAPAVDDPIHLYARYRAAIKGQDLTACRQEILTQAQGESMPDDVFLLSGLPNIEKQGAVVLLREIVGIPHEAVCYRAADASTSEMFLRVARLQPTFKYAVSQAFGSLYSRIGLPDEYEGRCRDVIRGIGAISWE
jgi:hypothetical protein